MSTTITTLQQVKDLDLNRFLQEELPIRQAILDHGITYYEDSQGYPGPSYISLKNLYNILDDEEQAEEMDFGWEDLNAFIQKHNLKLLPRTNKKQL